MTDIARYQADYLADDGFERHMVRYRRRKVLECLDAWPRARVLEVGCGMEPLFEHLSGWDEYTIVEPAPIFAANARDRIPAGRAVIIHEAFLETAAATLAESAFDVIVVSSLLHEIPDASSFLRTIRGLCAEATHVHVNVPNAMSLHNRMAVSMGIIPDVFARSARGETMQRKSTFDLAKLREIVESAGFRVESSGSYFLKPFTHGQLQRMLANEIIDERVLDALYAVNDDFHEAGAEIFVNLRAA